MKYSAGGGDSVKGNFVEAVSFFSLGAEIFPLKNFGPIWVYSCSLRILSGGGRRGLSRCCRQSVCSSRPFVLFAWE